MVQSSPLEHSSASSQLHALRESNIARRLEQQTARIPSVSYLGLALGSMIASAALAVFANRKEFANFVGLWAPSFLLMGIYNKFTRSELEHSELLRR